MPKFYVLVIILSLLHSLMCMEEQQRELSNAHIDEDTFFAHWQGFENAALEILENNRENTIEIKRDDKTLGVFHPKKKCVVSNFEQGTLELSYAAFVLRLKNTGNHEIKTMEYYQQLPSRNGVKIDRPDESPVLKLYHKLADQVGLKPEMQGEEKYLIEKKQKRCCCILY